MILNKNLISSGTIRCFLPFFFIYSFVAKMIDRWIDHHHHHHHDVLQMFVSAHVQLIGANVKDSAQAPIRMDSYRNHITNYSVRITLELVPAMNFFSFHVFTLLHDDSVHSFSFNFSFLLSIPSFLLRIFWSFTLPLFCEFVFFVVVVVLQLMMLLFFVHVLNGSI